MRYLGPTESDMHNAQNQGGSSRSRSVRSRDYAGQSGINHNGPMVRQVLHISTLETGKPRDGMRSSACLHWRVEPVTD